MSMESNHTAAGNRQSLWTFVISPAIWAAHFLFSYIAAAIWCGVVAGRGGDLGPIRAAIVAAAIVALIGIGVTGRVGWRRYMHGNVETVHHGDTVEDQYRFLGFTTVLISALSAVATIFVTLVTLFIRSCS